MSVTYGKAPTFWGSWKTGAWRVKRLVLRAPWQRPLFSERYRYEHRLLLGFGWRITWPRKDEAA